MCRGTSGAVSCPPSHPPWRFSDLCKQRSGNARGPDLSATPRAPAPAGPLSGVLATPETRPAHSLTRACAARSPLRRAILDAFTVTQTLELSVPSPRVTQTVQLPNGARLVLGAAASTSAAAPERVSFRFDEGFVQTNG